MTDDLGSRGVEDRRLALDDRDQRVAAVTDLEEDVADLGAALLAVLGEQRQLSLRERRRRGGHAETSIQRVPRSVAAWQRSGLVRDEPRPRQLREDLGVRLGGVGRLALDAAPCRAASSETAIDGAAADPAAARADGHDDRRPSPAPTMTWSVPPGQWK